MIENGLISIIVPAYNAEKTLLESLESLMRQSYKNFEVIIIDDGSTDDTLIIAHEYKKKDKRFQYFHQENSGVSIVRNRGIELSNGKYICFLDADDYFEDSYLEKMYNEIIEADSDICYCGYNIISNNSKSIKKTKFKAKNVLLGNIFGKINVNTTGWMIKKEFLEEKNIIFSIDVSWGEDIEFFYKALSETKKISFVNQYLTNYRVDHNENQLSSFSLDKIDKDFESIMKIVNNKNINKSNVIEKALIEYRLQALIIYRLMSAINKNMDINEINKYYKKYDKYIKKVTLNNGLRSLKLNINRIKLIMKMNKI